MNIVGVGTKIGDIVKERFISILGRIKMIKPNSNKFEREGR